MFVVFISSGLTDDPNRLMFWSETEIYSNFMQQQLELFRWDIPMFRFVTARSQTKTGCIKVAIGTLLYKMKPKTPNPSSISHPLLSPPLSYKHFWKSDKPSQKTDFPRVSINENPQMRPKCFAGFQRYICLCTACFYPTIQFASAVRPCLVSIFNTRQLYLRKQDFFNLKITNMRPAQSDDWTATCLQGVNSLDQTKINGDGVKCCLSLWLSHTLY